MSFEIARVLKKKTIVSYLEKKGHRPIRSLSGGRLTYLCPFPDHNESKPSFMVWTNSEFQNFHCFGCQRSYNIVHLVAGLEDIPYRKALELLSEDVEISILADCGVETEQLCKQTEQDMTKLDVAQKLYAIGTMCRYYLECVDYEEQEVKLVDKFNSVIDKYMANLEFDDIDACFLNLNKVIRARKDKFEKSKSMLRMAGPIRVPCFDGEENDPLLAL